jgi:adenylate cyclase
MLNAYFTAMVDVIFAHGGTVDKFVGDAIMAVWGAPLDQADHALRAVQTAQAMQAAVAALVAQWEAQGRGPQWEKLRIGIDVHSGPAVVGSFGAERRSDYTAIGDTVNVASRLESLSKDLGCAIVISAATTRALPSTSEATFQEFEPLGQVVVKGRDEPLEVYGLRR